MGVKKFTVEYFVNKYDGVHIVSYHKPKEVYVGSEYVLVVTEEGEEIEFTRRHVLRTTKTIEKETK